ncbi:MAG: DUF721 domain-containing protein [Symplocastrum torsivum CPER-KK1]|uniref:DUF721 domain-containing protein n=1 Tax=Symplocastrum torsivum CPER-KK1 TaxID=450513 RepID=A0A951PN03_9CYAN|nr:DUF721 domain-containing protein [Symplocastrum torsivum CPER-KK1]
MARTKTTSILNSRLAEIAGNAVAQQRRSHSFSRDVLSVVTSSSAWAQNLKFKRRSILKKLNARLSSPLCPQYQCPIPLGELSAGRFVAFVQ